MATIVEKLLGAVFDKAGGYLGDILSYMTRHNCKSVQQLMKEAKSTHNPAEKVAILQLLDERGALPENVSKKFREKYSSTIKFLK